MKPHLIPVEQLTSLDNLTLAFYRAARGKRRNPEVVAYARDLAASLARLSRDMIAGEFATQRPRRLVVHDPKRRVIHAPGFAERVLHHALMAPAAPVLERAMVSDTYACITGRGIHLAVERVRQHIRRHDWYVQIDIAGYFDHIDQETLLQLVRRRFKGDRFLLLIERIVRGYSVAPGKGLPIGTLISQHLANYYLDGFDRWLHAQPAVKAQVRYMDDVVWWCASREAARQSLAQAADFLLTSRQLAIKANPRINRCATGIGFCGVRINRNGVRLGPRRRRRYQARRRAWELAWSCGLISSTVLQRNYAAVHGITLPADSLGWRRAILARSGAVDA